jgi:Protein of unknown function (DUF2970)
MNTEAGSELRDAVTRPASFLQTIKAVAWSFLGIRKRSAYEQDVQKLNPVHVIIAGVIAAMIFIATLLMIVKWVVGSSS